MAKRGQNTSGRSVRAQQPSAPSPIAIAVDHLASTWKAWLPPFLLIVGATLWIYLPVIRGDWLLDDTWYYTKNPLLETSTGLWKFWFSPGSWVEYYPLNETVMWMQWQLWGGHDTLGYHLTTLLLHIISALLVWKLLRKFNLKLAWLGGLIFAIHPVQVESVATLAELKNTLSLPPFLLAMCAWVDYEEHGRVRDYWVALGLFLVAMLCKISMAPFPAVMLLYAWWKRGRIGWSDLKSCLPFLLISVVLGFMTVWAGQVYEATGHGQEDPIPLGGPLSRLAGVGLNFSFYFAICFLPIGLTPFHPQWTVDPHQIVQFLPWLISGAVVFCLWKKRRTWGRHVLLGLGFFAISLLPFIGFNAVSFMSFTWVLDHLLYFPVIGLIGVFVAGLGGLDDQLPKSGRILERAAVVVLMALMAFESRTYAAVYSDQGATWTYVLHLDPDNWLAHNDFGSYLSEKGRYPEAIAQLDWVTQVRPNFGQAHYNLGIALDKSGRSAEAEAQYRTALAIDPDDAASGLNLGVMMMRQGNDEEAEKLFRRALKAAPDDPMVGTDLADLLFRTGRVPEAVALYGQAVQTKPDLVQAQYDMGNALMQMGNLPEAEVHLAAAVDLDPSIAQAHENLGTVLARLGRVPEAIDQFQAALQIKPDYAQARDNLGFALAQSGRFPEAIEQFQQALKINPGDTRASDALAKIQQIQRQQNAGSH